MYKFPNFASFHSSMKYTVSLVDIVLCVLGGIHYTSNILMTFLYFTIWGESQQKLREIVIYQFSFVFCLICDLPTYHRN